MAPADKLLRDLRRSHQAVLQAQTRRDLALLAAIEGGVPRGKAASELGVTRQAVQQWLARLSASAPASTPSR